MPPGAGSRLGPYEILGPLGAGGMGEVYRARDTRLDWSADGKRLAVARATQSNDIVLFRGFRGSAER